MLRTTPIGPGVKEAGLRSADSLLANRQRRYATRAFELPHSNPIGDGVRNPLHPASLFAKLSRCATQDICQIPLSYGLTNSLNHDVKSLNK
jgi:hypothetical protein